MNLMFRGQSSHCFLFLQSFEDDLDLQLDGVTLS